MRLHSERMRRNVRSVKRVFRVADATLLDSCDRHRNEGGWGGVPETVPIYPRAPITSLRSGASLRRGEKKHAAPFCPSGGSSDQARGPDVRLHGERTHLPSPSRLLKKAERDRVCRDSLAPSRLELMDARRRCEDR